MKTKQPILQLANVVRKNALLLLAVSSLTISAQTIEQKKTVSANAVNSLNGTFRIPRAIDVISLDETRVISTTRKTSTSYELTSWEVSSSAITQKGIKLITANVEGIRSAKLSNTRFANAYTRSNKLYLEVWDVNATGTTLTLKSSKTGGDLFSNYRDFNLIALSASRLISMTVDASERLIFTTWDVASNGTLTQVTSSVQGGEVRSNLPATVLSSSKFVISYAAMGSSDVTHVFQVNSSGVVLHVKEYGTQNHSAIRLAALNSSRFVFAAPNDNDHLGYLHTFGLSSTNNLSILGSINNLVEAADGSITKLNTANVFTADISNATGYLTVTHTKIANDGTPTKKDEEVFNGTGIQAKATTLLANTTLARVVTGHITAANTLRLTSWDITIGTPLPRNTNDIESATEQQEQLVVYPNPASADAIFNFTLEEDAQASLKIYNALGELMSEVANDNYSKGTHQIVFPVENLASGVYYYSFETAGKQTTNKLVVQH